MANATFWIATGYSAVMGFIMGLVLGWHLHYGHTLPKPPK